MGANLARQLQAHGYEVHLLLRPEYSPWRTVDLHGAVKVHLVDLSSEGTVTGLVQAIKADWIFHLAANGTYPLQTDFKRMNEVWNRNPNMTGQPPYE